MKLNEMRKTSKINKLNIFCDLDGVLVDFESKAKEILNIDTFPSSNAPKDKDFDRRLWSAVRKLHSQNKPFWGDMDLMLDAKVLWNHIAKYDPKILTSTGKDFYEIGKKEKNDWVDEYLGTDVTVHVVSDSREKSKFAGPNKILIDDRTKSIDPWIARGGIGILHKNAKDTIKQLKELGI